MSSELVTLNIYNQNGFGIIGSQLENENSVENIIKRVNEENRKKDEERKRLKKQEAIKNLKYVSVPTSSKNNLLKSNGFYESGDKATVCAPRLAITPSTKLDDFDYSSVLNSDDYVSAGTSLTDLFTESGLLSSINITIGENRYTTLSDLVVESQIYNNTTSYTRGGNSGATLLPMDVLTMSNAKIDIALFVVEVYDSNMKLCDKCEITLPNGEVVGGNYNADVPVDFDFENAEILSTAKDTNGNVYTLKEGWKLGQVSKFLTSNMLEPTNISTYSSSQKDPNYESGNRGLVLEKPIESNVYKVQRHTSNIPAVSTGNLKAFTCYVKGFLVFNTNTKSDSPVDDPYHANMIWLEVPTQVNIAISDNKYTVNIGEIIDTSSAAVNNSITLQTKKFGETAIAYLPTDSDFYKNNFPDTSYDITGVTVSIHSLSKYYSPE